MARGKRNGGRIGFGRIEKDRRDGRARQQARKEAFGGSLVVGEERPNLEPLQTRSQNAVTRQAWPIHDAEGDSLRLANP